MSTTTTLMPVVSGARTKPDGSPFTPDDKEYWELERNGGIRRYQFIPYPTTVYRADTGPTGRVVLTSRIVQSEREHAEATAQGWYSHPDAAKDAHEASQQAIARAAAEAAHAAERLPEPAKREYKRRSAESPDHFTE